MNRQADVAAVVFVDVCGSVALYSDLGDAIGHRLVSSALAVATQAVTSSGGRVVKSLGDGFLATFADPEVAFRFALEVVSRGEPPELRLRAAVAFGEVLADGGDVFGDAVNVAARLLDRGGACEILVTEAVYVRLTAAERSVFADLGELGLRGRREPVRTYRILLNTATSDGGTATVAGERAGAAPPRLEVVCGDDRRVVDARYPRLRIGRAEDNDMVIHGERVSRYHAEIVLRGSQFLLVDRSVNGCWLQQGDAEAVPIHRTEVALLGAGRVAIPDLSGTQIRYGS